MSWCLCDYCVLAFLVSFVQGVSMSCCGNAWTEKVCAASADRLGLLSLHLLCLLCKVCHVVCGGGAAADRLGLLSGSNT